MIGTGNIYRQNPDGSWKIAYDFNLPQYPKFGQFLRQSLREYRLRRDFFCDALRTHFNDMIQFTIPEGGLSVWAGFDKSIDYQTFLQQAFLEGLTLSRCPETNPTQPWYNYCRLGFASSSLEELGRIIEIFKKLIR